MSRADVVSVARRELLKWAAAVPAGAMAFKTHAAGAATEAGIRGQKGKQYTIKLGSSMPANTENAHTVFFDRFVSELTAKTQGNVGAIFYGNSELGPENKYPNQLNVGTLDMMMAVSDWSPIVPEIAVLTMGFLFNSLEQLGQVLDGTAGKQLQDIFKKKTKAEILGWAFNFGGRNVLSKAAISAPADFHGKKIRVLPSPTFVQTFKLLGADPVPMPFNEVYTSLQTGVIDGLEHDSPTILQYKFYEVAKNLTLTQHIFDPLAPVISDATIRRLSPADRQAVRDAAAAAVQYQRPKATGAARQALEDLKNKGVKMIEIDQAKLRQEVKPLWKNFTGQYPDTKPVLQSILSVTGETL